MLIIIELDLIIKMNCGERDLENFHIRRVDKDTMLLSLSVSPISFWTPVSL